MFSAFRKYFREDSRKADFFKTKSRGAEASTYRPGFGQIDISNETRIFQIHQEMRNLMAGLHPPPLLLALTAGGADSFYLLPFQRTEEYRITFLFSFLVLQRYNIYSYYTNI